MKRTTAADAVWPAMEYGVVSPEMTMLLGAGGAGSAPLPGDAAALIFTFGGFGASALVQVVRAPDAEALAGEQVRVVLVVGCAALDRVFGDDLDDHDGRSFHLTPDLRAITVALRDCPMSGESRSTYRMAKSIELLCETVRLLQGGELAPAAADSALSMADTRRVMDARRMIDERWSEKLTLDLIARACGLNRAKLTRGFREVFSCTVSEAIADRRLEEASRKLRTTDKPVSSIGYESGYLNNASFARAFSRRFGVSPTEHRACKAVA